MTALEVVRQAFAGRQVLVLGSAPIDGRLELRPDDVVVPVNGGISSVPPGRPVDVWVLNARSDVHTWSAARRRLHETMLAQGADRDVAIAVLLTRDDDSEKVTRLRLERGRAHMRQVLEISRPERFELERVSGARVEAHKKDALSLGVFTAGMALAFGAAHVRLAGFSWAAGYAYLPNDPFVQDRGHVRADQLALAALAARHGDRLEHALEIPDRYTATVQKEIGVMATRQTRASSSSSTPATTEAGPSPGQRKVRATKEGFYGNIRQRVGDVFLLRKPSHFKESCMEDVAPTTPLGSAPPEAVKAPAFRMPNLKHNGADPVDDVDDDPRAGEGVL